MELAIILLLVVPPPVLWLISRAILYPTVTAAQKVRGPFRFQLLDFVVLILQIQLALAPILAWTSGEAVRPQRNLFLTLGLGATVAMWLGAVSFLSKAGVTQGIRRAIFILFYLPGTLAVLTIGPITLLLLFYLTSNEWPFWLGRPIPISGLIGLLVLTLPLGIGLRKLGEWLVK